MMNTTSLEDTEKREEAAKVEQDHCLEQNAGKQEDEQQKASQDKNNLVLLPGFNPWGCVSQSELGRLDLDGQGGSWAGKLGQDWMRLPGLEPEERSKPIRKDLPKMTGNMSGTTKKRKI